MSSKVQLHQNYLQSPSQKRKNKESEEIFATENYGLGGHGEMVQMENIRKLKNMDVSLFQRY